jgi:hypothetical protein
MFRKLITSAAILALMLSSAQAALLGDVEGSVSVSSGGGFKPITGSADIAPGTRIRTGDGSATITYPNGCTVRVGPHQIVAVLANPPVCNGAALLDTGFSTIAAAEALLIAGGVGSAIAASQSGNKPASP